MREKLQMRGEKDSLMLIVSLSNQIGVGLGEKKKRAKSKKA